MNDYERIAQIIRHLDKSHSDQPDLTALAQKAGLSPFHFHRLFSSWAGVTPKDFLQCLTVAHAKELLRDGDNILDVALESGLSGPGRLHDLCVNLEAASPGELKSGGAGWTISYGFAESPFGKCLIAESPRGICHLSFIELGGEMAAVNQLEDDWANATLQRNDSATKELVAMIFSSETTNANPTKSRPTLRALVRGTPFQVRVWRALLQIGSGSLTSYGQLAAALQQPTAARAVGSAVAANSIAYLIPCHRVIRETGVLGNYRWGPIRKRAMLAWETSQRLRPQSVAALT